MPKHVPTVDEMIPRAMSGLAPSTRELYTKYLGLLSERHGITKINKIVASDIRDLGDWAKAMAKKRRTCQWRVHAEARDQRMPPAVRDRYR